MGWRESDGVVGEGVPTSGRPYASVGWRNRRWVVGGGRYGHENPLVVRDAALARGWQHRGRTPPQADEDRAEAE